MPHFVENYSTQNFWSKNTHKLTNGLKQRTQDGCDVAHLCTTVLSVKCYLYLPLRVLTRRECSNSWAELTNPLCYVILLIGVSFCPCPFPSTRVNWWNTSQKLGVKNENWNIFFLWIVWLLNEVNQEWIQSQWGLNYVDIMYCYIYNKTAQNV